MLYEEKAPWPQSLAVMVGGSLLGWAIIIGTLAYLVK